MQNCNAIENIALSNMNAQSPTGTTTNLCIQSVDLDNESDYSCSNSFSFDSSCNHERINAGSKVNFSKLSEREKSARFKNMAKTIKSLKSKLRSIKRKYEDVKQDLKVNGIHKADKDCSRVKQAKERKIRSQCV